MALNTNELRQRLEDLLMQLQRYDGNLQSEFSMLDSAWGELHRAWDGYAYQQFEGQWEGTRRTFQEYLMIANRFESFLRERIEAMEELDNI